MLAGVAEFSARLRRPTLMGWSETEMSTIGCATPQSPTQPGAPCRDRSIGARLYICHRSCQCQGWILRALLYRGVQAQLSRTAELRCEGSLEHCALSAKDLLLRADDSQSELVIRESYGAFDGMPRRFPKERNEIRASPHWRDRTGPVLVVLSLRPFHST